jgi:hypothetical protein
MLKRLFKGFIYFLGICAFVGLLLSACEDEDATYVEHTGPNDAVLVVPEEPDSEVEVVVPEENYEEDFVFVEGPVAVPGEFSSVITGVVKNNTNKTYDYLQISFTLYDENDNVVDTAFTNINNVKPGQTWKFEAMYFEESAVRWELDEITGW